MYLEISIAVTRKVDAISSLYFASDEWLIRILIFSQATF